MKNCYHELPEGYTLVKEVDAVKDKKFAIGLNLAAVVLTVVAGVLLFFLRFKAFGDIEKLIVAFDSGTDSLWQLEKYLILLLPGFIAYIILHELTHGIVYKIMTHEKLKFGISLTCAYCGVPHVYVNRKTAISALVSPLILFSVIFIVMTFVTDGVLSLLFIIMFAMHFGGCAGDIYVTWLFLTSMRGDVLMKDTGPKQSFFVS